MNIVLTNDDGFSSPGIVLLAASLSRRDDAVYILAPDSDRSATSQCISFKRPVHIEARGERVWACSGTPSDCATVACSGGLGIKPDVIVSGINAGANLGTDTIYSGTCAAARQASLCGVPAIALSLFSRGENYNWEGAVDFCAAHFDEFYSLCSGDIFLNVNLPNTVDALTETRLSFPSRRRYQNLLVPLGPDGSAGESLHPMVLDPGGTDLFIDLGEINTEDEEGSDWDAVDKNFVSVSPVFIHPVIHGDLYQGAAGRRSEAGIFRCP
jgi:5'-nucleotidase